MLNAIKKFILLTVCVIGPLSQLEAVQEPDPVVFSKALNEQKLFDYSEYYLKNIIAAKPPDADRIKAGLAELYILCRRMPEADKLVKEIPRNSKYYLDVQLSMASAYYAAGQLAAAQNYLNTYFATAKDVKNPDENFKRDYAGAVNSMLAVIRDTGDFGKIAQAIKYLSIMQTDAAVLAVAESGVKLDIIQNMKDSKKPGWETLIPPILVQLEPLLWGSATPVTLSVYTLYIRALCIQGQYEKAVNEANDAEDMLQLFESSDSPLLRGAASPSFTFRYYRALAYLGRAQSERNDAQKKVLLGKVISDFFYIIMKSDDSALLSSSYFSMMSAMGAFEKLKGKVMFPEAFNRRCNSFGRADDTKMSSGNADLDKLFETRKYAEFVAKALPLLKADKNMIGADILGTRIIASLVNLGNYKDLMTFAPLAAANWPASRAVTDALGDAALNLANAGCISESLRLAELFLNNAPDTRENVMAAIDIAEALYNKSKAPTNLQSVQPAINDSYRPLIPFYRRIAGLCNAYQDACRRFFPLLAEVYQSAGFYDDAAAIYISCCEQFKGQKYNVLNAKIAAAGAYFQGMKYFYAKMTAAHESKDEKAFADAERMFKLFASRTVNQLRELLGRWISKDGVIGSPDEKMKPVLENAEFMLAGICDESGDKAGAVKEFKNFIEHYPNSPKLLAAMTRLAGLYYEMNDQAASDSMLESISLKFQGTEAAQNAYFNIGQDVYESGNYDKASEIIDKLLRSQGQTVAVPALLWIAENLYNSGGTHSKEAALLSLKAGMLLLEKLKYPVLSEWIGAKELADISQDPRKIEICVQSIKQRVLLAAAYSALYAGDISLSVTYFNQIIADRFSFQQMNARLGRAEAYVADKKFADAIADLNTVARMASARGVYSLSAKAEYLAGLACLKQGNTRKAFGYFYLASGRLKEAAEASETYLKRLTPERRGAFLEERRAESEWLEKSLYEAVRAAAQLSRTDDRQKLAELYKSKFPDGPHKAEVAGLAEIK